MTDRTIHRIDDLAIPRLPLALHAMNRLAGPFAGRLLRLDEQALLGEARRRSGLDDFGDESFLPGLRVLLEAIDRENESTPLGRFLTRELVTGLLVTRLRLEALERAHPEVLEEEVREPLVIAGLPRTGTTHLHNLIAQDARFRSMPYWEGLEPIPPLDRLLESREGDPRIARCAQALKVVGYAMPLFPAMHEITPESRHEEIQLLAADFRSMLFEVSYWIPSYRDWYVATDQTPGYRFLKRMLKAMQWLHGPRRWALKSPQHIEQLGPLLEVFPDARVVQTHRDPVSVVASLTTMVAYGQRMQRDHVDRHELGAYWAGRIEAMLGASVRDRPLLPEGQVIDVGFQELVGDNLGAVERVYELVGLELDDRAREAVATYRDRNPRGKHGKVAYRLADFGLDEGEVRERLRFYSDRFDVPADRPGRVAA